MPKVEILLFYKTIIMSICFCWSPNKHIKILFLNSSYVYNANKNVQTIFFILAQVLLRKLVVQRCSRSDFFICDLGIFLYLVREREKYEQSIKCAAVHLII